jgi:hypothetical protein
MARRKRSIEHEKAKREKALLAAHLDEVNLYGWFQARTILKKRIGKYNNETSVDAVWRKDKDGTVRALNCTQHPQPEMHSTNTHPIKVEYLIQWEGSDGPLCGKALPDSQNTWEPASAVAVTLVSAYETAISLVVCAYQHMH